MESLILASASPRRRELLGQAGIPFTVQPSGVDEASLILTGSPAEKAEQLAAAKAEDIASVNSSGIVLGADTIVELDGEIFGKPADEADAFSMLTRLQGKQHRVITGIALIDCKTGVRRQAHESTLVTFAKLSAEEIKAYISTGEPFDKAGAYGIQGKAALFVEGICGCYPNIVGLPLMRLGRLLEEFGVKALL